MGSTSTQGSSASKRSGIFISYRRDDTAGHAGRLYDRLTARFGAKRVFMDVDKIGPGVDFVRKIEEAVKSSRVLLALMGRSWLSATSADGQRRIDDPRDFVRLEIATALEEDLLVVPLLVQGAVMPGADDLPEPLSTLARRNALELTNERFDYDVARIVEAVEEAIGERTPSRQRRTVPCPSCGRKNPSDAQFCPACGARLSKAAPPPAQERKVVTVLHCGLVGFAPAADEADPEDVQALLRQYHSVVRREVERFGGTLDKLMGDAVMAVFGAPASHEDDPERAVRAALRIVEDVPELSQSRGLSLSARIGAHTEEAMVSLGVLRDEGESIVTGAVVNTASSLQAAAPAGAVVVGESTYRATRHQFNYAELPRITLGGRASPVPIWHALSARSRVATEIERPTTPFVDREVDFALLKGAFTKSLQGPTVQLVTITGEPGVGKSRLTGELLRFIDEQPDLINWREGRCLPYGEGITFWALGEIVKAQAGILESDGPDEASAKLAESVDALVEEESEREWLKSRLGPLVGLQSTGGPAEREENFTAWRRYLEAVAAHGPLVMVVEHLQYADPAMLDFLEHLVEYASGVPLLVIAGARPELYERRPNWGGGIRGAITISLAPLSDPDCAALLSALLDRAVLPAEVQSELLGRAGGNPLYAEEFVRLLDDKGLLPQEGEAIEARDLSGVELPATVQALIAARLDTLSPERKALLQDASVIGRVFWSGAIASMGDRNELEVRRDLHDLVRKELVREARTSTVEGEAEYLLWHALVRDVCYAQIPRAERGRKHRAAAAWIEALAGERVADHAEFLAHHYRQALDLARASGETEEIPQLEQASLRFLVMAGERAMQLDVAQAESHYRSALELASAGHADRGAILAQLGEATFMAGRFDESESTFTEAVDELRSHDHVLAAGEAMRMLARLVAYRGDVAASRQTLVRAVELLEGQPPGRELVRALSDLAYDQAVSGLAEEGLAAAERALELARELGLDVEEVRALPRRGTAMCMLGDPRGVEDFRTALERGLILGLGRDIAVVHNNLGEALWPVEGPHAGLESYRAGASFSEARGMLLDAYTNRSSSLGAMLMVGDWDDVLAESTEVVDWLRAHGATLTEAWAAMWRAHALLGRGEWNEAETLVQTYLPRVREIGDLENVLPALAAGALLERGKHDVPAALTLVREFEQAARSQGTWYRAQFLPDLVRMCREGGDLALGEGLVEEVPDRTPGHRLALAAAGAALAEGRGNLEEGLRLYEEVGQALESFGWPLERGQALMGEGRCLHGLGRSTEAVSKLEQARQRFARLAARPLVAEAEALLGNGAALSS